MDEVPKNRRINKTGRGWIMVNKADAIKARILYTPTDRKLLLLTDQQLEELRKRYPWMWIRNLFSTEN